MSSKTASSQLETYAKDCVFYCEKGAAVCLLCPTTLSSDSKVISSSPVVQQHFLRMHLKKDGFVYCAPCSKSVCMIGQSQQIEQHAATVAHVKKAEKGTVRFCETCGTVDPPPSHNPSHVTVEFKKPTMQEELSHASKDLFAQKVFSLWYRSKETVTIGYMCNEHFEKVFECTPGSTPVPMTQNCAKRRFCKPCERMRAIWSDCKVREGYRFDVDPVDYKKYAFVCAPAPEDEYDSEISMQMYMELASDVQDLYVFEPSIKAFRLDRGKAKKAVTKRFIRNAQEDGKSSTAPKHDDDDENVEDEEVLEA